MAGQAAYPARAVLRGVPRVHFYEGGERCPEDITFPSAVRAVMESLGENIGCKHCRARGSGADWGMGCAYAHASAVSGLAFVLGWAPGFGPETFGLINALDPGSAAPAPAAPFQATFDALGYGFEYLPAGTGEETLREKIRASIAGAKHPLIAFGVAGPPEVAIITGYDDDGGALIGWSFFQEMPGFSAGLEKEEAETPGAPSYFRQPGWYDGSQSVVVIGEKGQRPADEVVVIDALRRGIAIMKPRQAGSMQAGLAAYSAWAADLLRDELFPAGDEAALRQRHEVHGFAVGQLAELRWNAAMWIANVVEKVQNYASTAGLLHAAACFAAEHALMWQVWNLTGGINNPDAWRMLADPGVRRQVADVILAARAQDEQALAWLEEAVG